MDTANGFYPGSFIFAKDRKLVFNIWRTVFKLLIKQIPDLLYKKIDDKYYITNTFRKEVIVVNEPAFKILELSDSKTVDEIAALVKDDMGMTCEEVSEFLKQLSSAGLLEGLA